MQQLFLNITLSLPLSLFVSFVHLRLFNVICKCFLNAVSLKSSSRVIVPFIPYGFLASAEGWNLLLFLFPFKLGDKDYEERQQQIQMREALLPILQILDFLTLSLSHRASWFLGLLLEKLYIGNTDSTTLKHATKMKPLNIKG